MKRRRTVWEYVDLLKEQFPLSQPVRVVLGQTTLNKDRYPYAREQGLASIGKSGYYILINKKGTRNEKIDTLFHEWAHCRVGWEEGEDHSDEWGVEYARIYRKMIE